jgi:hypothetical protein
MDAVFTIFFEDPFWVGILESEDEGRLTVARHVFGAEPSNAELLSFMLYRFADMPRSASRPGTGARERGGPLNPKRAAREARREQSRPISTKAQAALSAARSELKSERKASAGERRRELEERRYELRSEKRRRRRAGH